MALSRTRASDISARRDRNDKSRAPHRALQANAARVRRARRLRHPDVDLKPLLHHRGAVAFRAPHEARADLGIRERLARRRIPDPSGRDRGSLPHGERHAPLPHDVPRGDRKGLRENSARERNARIPDSLPPRSPECVSPDHHVDRCRDPASLHGVACHGKLLRHSRSRQLHDRRNQ